MAAGCIVSGGQVKRSILHPEVRVNSYAVCEECILFDSVDVGRYCRLRRVIVDKYVKLPPYTVIGFDHAFDRRRGFTVTEGGVVVVPKGERPEAFEAARFCIDTLKETVPIWKKETWAEGSGWGTDAAPIAEVADRQVTAPAGVGAPGLGEEAGVRGARVGRVVVRTPLYRLLRA